MINARAWLGELIRIAAPLAILAAGAAGMGFLWSLKEAPAVATPQVEPPLVETVAVVPHEEGLDIATDGLVVPARDVTVATQVAGKIVYKSPLCEAGKFVTAGEVLFRIDAQDYALEVERLAKERAQADASLQEVDLELQNTQTLIELAQEEVELQQRELQRLAQLRGPAVSQSAIDQARRAELQARNALQTLENQKRLLETRRTTTRIARELAEVRLEKAQLDLERTEVKAPVSGVIVEEMVEEDSFAAVGAALAVIEDTSTVEVRCSLRMEELDWLWRQPSEPVDTPYTPAGFSIDRNPDADKLGDRPAPRPVGLAAYQLPRTPVTVIYEIGGRRYAWQGVLDRFEGIGLDERTRTVPCRVVVPNPRSVRRLDANGGGLDGGPRALVRGMFVTLRIHAQPDAALVRVPEEAIRPGGKVFVARNGSVSESGNPARSEGAANEASPTRLYEVKVQTAAVVDGWAVIDADAFHLKPGDRVAVTPVVLESAGDELRMIPPKGIPVKEIRRP